MDPTKKLDFSLAAVTNGNVDKTVVEARVVMEIPATIQAKEARMPAKGPESAKSNREALLAGNDLSGVMHPYRPRPEEKTGTGLPIRIPRRLATK